jgi:tRNA (cytidine32/uridine32-2'-O)-methyltransferase
MDNIRIVMVRTHTAGNIGAASRAMKNMGLRQLMLVSPTCGADDVFRSEGEAAKMATRGAEDVLQGARVVDSLYSAVRDCSLVIACTARPRSFDLPVLSPEQAAQRLYSTAAARNSSTSSSSSSIIGTTLRRCDNEVPSVALVFGPERAGLLNEDIQLAHYRVTIPSNPANPSLNLAAAVQILSYEICKVHQKLHEETLSPISTNSLQTILSSSSNNCNTTTTMNNNNVELPSIAQREGFYETLEEVLKESGMAHKDDPRHLMQKMRRILDRAEPEVSELSLLRGALASIQRRFRGRDTTTK